MRRVSLGIILLGDPDKIQTETPWLKKLEWISTKGFFIAGSLLMVGVIGSFFIEDLIYLEIIMLVPFLMLLCTAFLIWDDKTRCPYCRHFFSMRRIGEEKLVDISEREISRTVDDYRTGTAVDWNGNIAFFDTKTSYKEYGKEVTEDYAFNVRCSCCGCVNKIKASRSKKVY